VLILNTNSKQVSPQTVVPYINNAPRAGTVSTDPVFIAKLTTPVRTLPIRKKNSWFLFTAESKQQQFERDFLSEQCSHCPGMRGFSGVEYMAHIRSTT